MEKAIHRRGRPGRQGLALLLVFALIVSLIFAVPAAPAKADSVRAATVAQVSGNATYKKSGGTRSNSIYVDLKLNQGDLISTGAGSSVVLRLADRDDEITIGENAEVYISDLIDSGGKKSKVKSFAGAIWAKVKSLVSSEDEFEIETPTAVMGVRGTFFFSSVNPVTGATDLLVAAGKVRLSTTANTSNETSQQPSQSHQSVLVYPAQQLNLDSRAQVADLRMRVNYADIQSIVSLASPKVIEAFIRSVPGIQQELDGQKKLLQEKFEQGVQSPDEGTVLKIATSEDLEKVRRNFDALIPNLAKEAIDQKKLERRVVEDVNNELTDPAKKIDLDRVPALDKTAGMDPEVEKAKQAAIAQERRLAEEQARLAKSKEALASVIDGLEKDRKRLEEANSRTEANQNQEAEKALLSQLDAKAQEAYNANKAKNTPAGGNSSSGSSGSSDNGGSPGTPVDPGKPNSPSVTLAQTGSVYTGTTGGRYVNLTLSMNHFTANEPFYAVQAHLLYGSGQFRYAGGAQPQDVPGTVFVGPQTAESVKEVSGIPQTELIYAATQFAAAGTAGLPNLKLDEASKPLITIPLQLINVPAGGASVQLAYVKVVDKDGKTVYETTAKTSVQVNGQ